MVTRRKKRIIRALAVVFGLPITLVLLFVLFLNLLNPVILGSSNQVNGSIVSSGKKREYLLYIPASYDRTRPTPLVLSLHAAALWPATQMQISQWNKLADQHGFIVVYPSGIPIAPLPLLPALPVWLVRGDAGRTADVRFLSDLIDKLEGSYNIDPARIYVNGFSNGGGMTFVVSCTLSHRIAAVGTVAAAQDLPWSWCTDSRPVPMIAFHGTADPFVPYNGGKSLASPKPFPSVGEWSANWARRNRCGPSPVESAAAANVSRLEYTGCANNAAVVLYTIRGGGHSWPGGKPMPKWMVGTTSRSIDATSQMWAFFREHPIAQR